MIDASSPLARVQRTWILTAIALLTPLASAHATFSICAVDPATGEVGSAGASCISGSIILSDVHPGVGVVHTQSYWNAENQAYARALMDAGIPPDAIIDSLVAHDAQDAPEFRQYGIVDLVGGGRSAAFTGSSCIDHASDHTEPTFAVAGNILIGPGIIADMELAFETTDGTLADRLMAALIAANVPGADTRCLDDDKPAISAFLRVARPDDPDDDLTLDLNVNNTSSSQNPIDLLAEAYDEWQSTVSVPDAAITPSLVLHPVRPNPARTEATIRFEVALRSRVRVEVFDVNGRSVTTLVDGRMAAGAHHVTWDASPHLASGVYAVRVEGNGERRVERITLLR